MFDSLRKRNPHWWVPWTFVGFFGVMLVANGTMLYYAVTTFTGVETNNAYRRGVQYNEKLDAAAAQRALGWTADFDFRQTADRTGRVVLDMSDKANRPLNAAKVKATFVRPTHAGSDFASDMEVWGTGRYGVEVVFPLAGQWDVRLDVAHSRGSYVMKERVYVRP